jgi:hypothetical protein
MTIALYNTVAIATPKSVAENKRQFTAFLQYQITQVVG